MYNNLKLILSNFYKRPLRFTWYSPTNGSDSFSNSLNLILEAYTTSNNYNLLQPHLQIFKFVMPLPPSSSTPMLFQIVEIWQIYKVWIHSTTKHQDMCIPWTSTFWCSLYCMPLSSSHYLVMPPQYCLPPANSLENELFASQVSLWNTIKLI